MKPEASTTDSLQRRLAGLSPAQREALRRRLARDPAPPPMAGSTSPLEPGSGPAGPSHVSPATVSGPLSPAQHRMCFLQAWVGDQPVYQAAREFLLLGPLRPELLRRALEELGRRHESLRTGFRMDSAGAGGRDEMVAWTETPERCLPRFLECAATGDTTAARRLDAKETWRRAACESFDLASPPLWRAMLIRIDPEEHLLGLCVHQSVSDGWSMGILSRELAVLYASGFGDAPTRPLAAAGSYRAFVDWQSRRRSSPEWLAQESYWLRALADAPPPLELPGDRPRPATPTFRGRRLDGSLDAGLVGRVESLARALGVTPFVVFLAAFQALLSRLTGRIDLAVGVPIANRGRVEDESTVGVFVNTLVVRTRLDGDPGFREVIRRVEEASTGALAHQEYPFEELVRRLALDREPGRHPLHQVAFAYHRFPEDELHLHGLSVTMTRTDLGTAKFDLSLRLDRHADGVGYAFEYSTEAFDAPTLERWAGHYRTLLDSLVEQPDRPIFQAELLSAPEKQRILHDWNDTSRRHDPAACLHDLVEEQARRTPDAVAVVSAGRAVTYAELLRRAKRLAARLVEAGVAQDTPVGILLDRSEELVIGVLAVLQAGGAYLPLDPRHPPERRAWMWRDSRASLVLTSASLRAELPPQVPTIVEVDTPAAATAAMASAPTGADAPGRRVRPEHLAYILYTSGSSGTPKGVAVEHRSVANFLRAMRESPGCGPDDVVLALTTLGFDIAVLELFLPLTCGARVVVASDDDRYDPSRIADLVDRHEVTMVQATPATWRLLQSIGWSPRRRMRALCGGETLPRDLAGWLLERTSELWNLYGPTETTVWSTVARIESDQDIVIGRPIANTRAYVVDARGQPVPVGIPGELWLGGGGLARGYLHRPDLTDERFAADPFSGRPGDRIYRTGDLVRHRPDGRLEHLGRLDQQIKIHGFRVEPGEIEACLTRLPGVASAVVVPVRQSSDEVRLHAFLVIDPKAVPPPSVRDLRSALASLLPSYMVPVAWTPIPSVPVSPNGKVDRAALAALAVPTEEPRATREEPRTELERGIARIWREVLGRAEVGLHDPFFELGGHSLLAVRMLNRLRNELGLAATLTGFFRHPTIAALADSRPGERSPARGQRPFLGAATGIPLFVVPGIFGIPTLPPSLARAIAGTTPYHVGLRFAGVDDDRTPHATMEDIAAHLVAQIEAVHPPADGPLHLAGFSFGGTVAFEVARQLMRRGREIPALLLYDGRFPGGARLRSWPEYLREIAARVLRQPPGQRMRFVAGLIRAKLSTAHPRLRGLQPAAEGPRRHPPRDGAHGPSATVERLEETGHLREAVRLASRQAYRLFHPGSYPGRVVLFRATEHESNEFLRRELPRDNGWGAHVTGCLEIVQIPRHHLGIFTEPMHPVVLQRTISELESGR